ncbi:hypothetical protein JCM10914A_32390 [Paenibacillus sp. JCM 10914]
MNITIMQNHQLKQAVELSDRIFLKQPEQRSMGVSFPPIFSPGISHSYGAWDDQKLVSFMGFVPYTMQIHDAKLNVYSIGSVCTDPDYRGQRLAGSILEQCFRHAESSLASLIFISGGRSLYTRAGSRRFGRAVRYHLLPGNAESLRSAGNPRSKIRKMQPEDLFKLHAVMEQRQARYTTTPSELDRLLGASAYSNVIRMQQQVLVAEDGGQLIAYAIIAVPGMELTPSREATLVEWGGQPAAAAHMIGEAIQSLHLPELTVPLAWQDQQLATLLHAAGATSETIQNDGTVYVVSGPQLLLQLASWLPEHIIEAAGDHGPYQLHLAETTLQLDDEGLLSILFDPESPYRAAHNIPFDPIPLPYTSGLQYI